MECLQNRIDSFNKPVRVQNASKTGATKNIKWPHPSSFIAIPLTLAEAGFYFDPSYEERDNVTCFVCGKELAGWEEHDDPFEIHWRKCAKTCAWAVVRCALKGDLDASGRFAFTDKNRLPSSKLLEKARQQTYTVGDGWIHDQVRNHGASSKRMAKAGFLFTPVHPGDDSAACLYCKLSLNEWDTGDDPLEEHRKRRGTVCPFFIGSVSNTLTTSTSTKPTRSSSSSSLTKPPSSSRTSTAATTRGRSHSVMPDIFEDTIEPLAPPAEAGPSKKSGKKASSSSRSRSRKTITSIEEEPEDKQGEEEEEEPKEKPRASTRSLSRSVSRKRNASSSSRGKKPVSTVNEEEEEVEESITVAPAGPTTTSITKKGSGSSRSQSRRSTKPTIIVKLEAEPTDEDESGSDEDETEHTTLNKSTLSKNSKKSSKSSSGSKKKKSTIVLSPSLEDYATAPEEAHEDDDGVEDGVEKGSPVVVVPKKKPSSRSIAKTKTKTRIDVLATEEGEDEEERQVLGKSTTSKAKKSTTASKKSTATRRKKATTSAIVDYDGGEESDQETLGKSSTKAKKQKSTRTKKTAMPTTTEEEEVEEEELEEEKPAPAPAPPQAPATKTKKSFKAKQESPATTTTITSTISAATSIATIEIGGTDQDEELEPEHTQQKKSKSKSHSRSAKAKLAVSRKKESHILETEDEDKDGDEEMGEEPVVTRIANKGGKAMARAIGVEDDRDEASGKKRRKKEADIDVDEDEEMQTPEEAIVSKTETKKRSVKGRTKQAEEEVEADEDAEMRAVSATLKKSSSSVKGTKPALEVFEKHESVGGDSSTAMIEPHETKGKSKQVEPRASKTVLTEEQTSKPSILPSFNGWPFNTVTATTTAVPVKWDEPIRQVSSDYSDSDVEMEDATIVRKMKMKKPTSTERLQLPSPPPSVPLLQIQTQSESQHIFEPSHEQEKLTNSEDEVQANLEDVELDEVNDNKMDDHTVQQLELSQEQQHGDHNGRINDDEIISFAPRLVTKSSSEAEQQQRPRTPNLVPFQMAMGSSSALGGSGLSSVGGLGLVGGEERKAEVTEIPKTPPRMFLEGVVPPVPSTSTATVDKDMKINVEDAHTDPKSSTKPKSEQIEDRHHQTPPQEQADKSKVPQQFTPFLSKLPFVPLNVLSDAELDMTVEEWIRYQIEVEYDKFKRDGERELARFRKNAEETRKIIEGL